METDNFSYSNRLQLKDSSSSINKIFEDLLNSAIEGANKSTKNISSEKASEFVAKSLSGEQSVGEVDNDCNCEDSEMKFESERRKFEKDSSFGLPPLPKKTRKFENPLCDKNKILAHLIVNLDMNWPKIRNQMLLDTKIKKSGVNLQRKSIYSGMDGGVVLGKGCCDPLVNIDGHYIGIDKIDHLFGHGYIYYKKYMESKSVQSSLAEGLRREKGAWGLASTGVMSYGDMVANYSGLHLWANLIDGDSPLIKCNNGKFERSKRSFDIRNFINSGMDESINCSSFSKKDMAKEVDRRTGTEKFKDILGVKGQCPVDLWECHKLKEFYSAEEEVALLHPRCLKGNKTESIYEPYKTKLSDIVEGIQNLKGMNE